jgi:hypothetical protein
MGILYKGNWDMSKKIVNYDDLPERITGNSKSILSGDKHREYTLVPQYNSDPYYRKSIPHTDNKRYSYNDVINKLNDIKEFDGGKRKTKKSKKSKKSRKSKTSKKR